MAKPVRVLTIFGTRPEAIKMAPLVKALEACPDTEQRLCVTAQHRDMLDQVLELFDLHPHHDLDLMQPNQTLFQLTARVITKLQPVLEAEKPDVVLVHGDTTTTMAGALAAFYARVHVGHVEAGLRTWNLAAPFPEEANRQLADRLCSFLFAPTEGARQALLREGLRDENIRVTGNTVIDALLMVRDQAVAKPLEPWREVYGSAFQVVADGRVPMVLITGHRRESFGQGFEDMCAAIRTLAERHPQVHYVYPVHLNPNVRKPVNAHLAGLPNIHLIDPLDYEPFVRLMDRSTIILTDSGGIQEEAPSLGKPVLVMRETTERPEGVEAGTVKLVGTDRAAIIDNTEALLFDPAAYEAMHRAHNPYGDGKASERHIEFILERLG
jgi:UDP-N-acetylglucosamine 2-epimerase (non-hydrolysing)